jgi:MoaA/NifB/PqqE/SkfB family radical SAM enzyme
VSILRACAERLKHSCVIGANARSKNEPIKVQKNDFFKKRIKHRKSVMEKKTLQFFRDIQNEDGRALLGPRQLQIDITNNCNTNCIGCWCHSDYLGDKKLSAAEKKVALSYETICQVIDDAAALNIAKIQLAGSGDPLIHPDFVKIITYIKSKNLQLEVLTNGIALNDTIIDVLVKNRVDDLVISMWAGTAKMYSRIHPNQPKATFHAIIRQLKKLHTVKSQSSGLPIVRMYHVVTSVNHAEIRAMVECAFQAHVEKVEFQVVDIVPGKTDFLKLGRRQIHTIKKQFAAASRWSNFVTVTKYDTEEFSEFGRMVHVAQAQDNFRFFFVDAHFYTVLCPLGMQSYKHQENVEHGHYDFFFDRESCSKCLRFKECSIDKTSFSKRVFFLSIVGVQTFLRRLTCVVEGKEDFYDPQMEHMPCYAGWDYSRILTNGDVVPCCKGHLNPLGNLKKESFLSIWNSKKYARFRQNAKLLPKTDEYFKNFECLQGCDNYSRNAQIARQAKALEMQGKI